MVKADWIKPGATVIDVGINRIAAPDGVTRLVGDVDFAAARARRRRDHPGAGRGRADDDRLPVAQHALGGLPAPRPARPRCVSRLTTD